MPKRVHIPALRRKGKYAVVTLPDIVTGRRHDYVCGRDGTLAAVSEYRRVLVEWQANDRRLKQETDGASVAELLLAYWQHAQKYYRHPDGRPTTEIANLKPPLRRLRELYADKPAADIDSLALVAVRDGMIRDGLARKHINKDIDRIKRVFKWAAAQKLVPIATYQQLTTLDGLRRGRSAAKESTPVKPVPDCWVNDTLPYLHPTVRAMVELQRATGMRPTEVCILRGCDIDMTGKIWTYMPSDHKNSYREHERIVAIGPRGQALLRPHLKLDLQAYVFDPREAVEAWIAVKRANRKSKVTPSQAKRRRKKAAKRQPGQRYTRDSYRVAVTRGIERANQARTGQDELPIPHWHPSQLRHSYGTEVRSNSAWTPPVLF